jgi:alkanesulfonate monooxygenase SsuD/methylene tetrahydromethanopterin reductase-like flavin-dependent oxidoreductase (luciferase family)
MRIGNANSLLAPPERRLRRATQRAAATSLERPAARRSAVERGLDRRRSMGFGTKLRARGAFSGQAKLDVSGATAAIITQMQNAFALNIGKLVGSPTTVAKQLDELAMIDGLKGVMCIFDDFVAGTEDFGRNVMPLLHCR